MSADILTLERLMECVRSLPPAPPKTTFASCRMFPTTGIGFRGDDGEEFVVAHPDYWTAVKDKVSSAAPTLAVSDQVLRGVSLPLWGITVADLDHDPAERQRIMVQMGKVMSRSVRQSGGDFAQQNEPNPDTTANSEGGES